MVPIIELRDANINIVNDRWIRSTYVQVTHIANITSTDIDEAHTHLGPVWLMEVKHKRKWIEKSDGKETKTIIVQNCLVHNKETD